MGNSSINTIYKAFGLIIVSDFRLLELTEVNDDEKTPDLMIVKEDLVSMWENNAKTDPYYLIKENFCMVRVPDVALFKIENGNLISYCPFKKSNDDQIRLYLLGTCLGVALLQRKVLPLHGSSIAIDGKAYAFVGDSGVGKSTLASAFINRGFQMLTDDVIAVTLTRDNTPFVTPSYPQQKLWQESLDNFGIESNQFQPIFNRETKFAIPVKKHFIDEPLPLAGIFVLSKDDQKEIKMDPIQNLHRLPILYENTYRQFMVHRLGRLEWHFHFIAKMAQKIDLHQIIRPTSRFTADELVDDILNLIYETQQTYKQKTITMNQRSGKEWLQSTIK